MKTTNAKLTLLIPSLCLVALAGRTLFSDGGVDTLGSTHRLALEVTHGKLRKNMGTKTAMEFDVSVKEEDAGYDMKLGVTAGLGIAKGKPGKPSPQQARAVAKIESKLGQPDGKAVYMFPRSMNLDNTEAFNPAFVLEVMLDIATQQEKIMFELIDEKTGNKMVTRSATESQGIVTYRCPLMEGEYIVRLVDGKGQVLEEGEYGHMKVAVNKHNILYDSGDFSGAMIKKEDMKMGLRFGLGKGKPGKPSPQQARAVAKIESKLGEPTGRAVYLFPRSMDLGNTDAFNPAFVLEIMLDISTQKEKITFELVDKTTGNKMVTRSATESQGIVTYRCPLMVGEYIVRLVDAEGQVLGEGEYGHMTVAVNKHKLLDDSEDVSGAQFDVTSHDLSDADVTSNNPSDAVVVPASV